MKKLIGPVIGVGCLLLVVGQLGVAWEDFSQVNVLAAAWSAVIVAASMLCRAAAWAFMVRGVTRARFSSIVIATFVGFFAGAILPSRLGEIVRAYVLSRREDMPLTSSLATVVVARLFDGLTLVLMMALTLLLVHLDEPLRIPQLGNLVIDRSLLNLVGLSVAALFAGVLVALLLFHLAPDRMRRVLDRVLSPISKTLARRVGDLFASFEKGLQVLGDPRLIGGAALFTLLGWALIVISVHPLLGAYPFGVELPATTALTVETVLCVGLTVPNAPGFLGTFELGTVAGLLISNPAVDPDQASAFSLLMHAVQFLPIILLGFACTTMLDFSIFTIRRKLEPPAGAR